MQVRSASPRRFACRIVRGFAALSMSLLLGACWHFNEDITNNTNQKVSKIKVLIRVEGYSPQLPTVSEWYNGNPPDTVNVIGGPNNPIFELIWNETLQPGQKIHVGWEFSDPNVKFKKVADGFEFALNGGTQSHGALGMGTRFDPVLGLVIDASVDANAPSSVLVQRIDWVPVHSTLPLGDLVPGNGNLEALPWTSAIGGPFSLPPGGSTTLDAPDWALQGYSHGLVRYEIQDTLHGVPRAGILQSPLDTAPVNYCTSSTTTNGCVPSIVASANPNVAHSNSCNVLVGSVEGQKFGLVFYGLAPSSIPWGAGGTSTLCVKAPTQRTPPQGSGGSLNSCNGQMFLDWNSFQTSHVGSIGQPWTVGANAYLQAWFRDPPAVKTTNLSDAVKLTYVP